MPESQSQWRTIGELADTNPEALGLGADHRSHFKYVDLSSVTAGTVAWNSAPEVTFLTAPSRARRVLRRGDVLFGTVRPNLQSHGYVDWTGNSALVGSTGFSVIRAKAGVSDPRYLFHCIMGSGVTAQANRDAVGSSYPALNDSDVRRFEVFAPPIGEQVAVAQVLDTLDTTIRQTEAIIEKLKQVKQGLLQDLLTRGIDANGELRPPQSQAPHLYKDSPLGWIPREWEAPRLESCTRWSSGGTPSRAVSANWIGQVALLTPKDMKSFELSDTTEHISQGAAATGTKLMPAGTVFIVVRGMILAHSFPVVLSQSQMAFNQDIKAISAGSGLLPRFLAHWFSANTELFLRKVTESTHGTKKLDADQLLPLHIGLPPEKEQHAVVERYSALDTRIARESEYVVQLLALKNGLMDDLLTGRVRVTPLLVQ